LELALERLNEVGVSHNDIHLSNVCVLIGNEETVRATIIDFGLALFENNPRYEK